MTARAALLAGAALLIAGAAAGAPVPTAKPAYEPPTATAQTAKLGAALLDFAAYCREVFDKETNDKLAALAADGLMAKAAAAVDLDRRAGAYLYLRADPAESAAVVVLPVKGEKETLALFADLGFEVKETKAGGLHVLTEIKLPRWHTFAFLNDVSPVVRFHDKCAYLALHNGSSKVLDSADKLIPLGALADDKETALAAVKLDLDRYPQELQQPLFGVLAEAQENIVRMQQRANPGMPKGFPACARQCVDWCQRNLPAVFAEGAALTARLTLDAKAADHDIEVALVPKPKTPLAADIRAIAKAKGRFAQLTADAVTGVTLTLPGPIPDDIRTTAGVFLSDWLGLGFANVPPAMAPLNEPLCAVLNAQVGAGQVDVGGAVYGPDKAGLYTAVAAVALADGAATGKALRDACANAPKEALDLIKWDAVKVGDGKAHTADVAEALPMEVRKLFGEASTLHVLFTKDAAVIGIGPESVARMAKAAALKPAECVGFCMPIHRAKFSALAAAFDDRGRPLPLAAKDGLLPVYRADILGGDALRIRFHFGLAPFLMADRAR